MKATENFISQKLQQRIENQSLRSLSAKSALIDFCSNDYLGFCNSDKLQARILQAASNSKESLSGSTGSRLISGNDFNIEDLEQKIAKFHNIEAGLIFNSGYDANLGIFSSLPQRGDTIITDELIHASIIDGARLSFANRYSFLHNDLQSLEDKLRIAKGRIYVGVESIYSMDGDEAPLEAIIELADKYDAAVIVDEAHATGIFGSKGCGLVQRHNLQHRVFARIITFGKALGCHGAIVLGSEALRKYLINFARSFIYTTTACPFNHICIDQAYQYLQEGNFQAEISRKILFFKSLMAEFSSQFVNSNSAIQCLIHPGNDTVRHLEKQMNLAGFDVRAILHPTVPEGKERLRFCLHTFNTDDEIRDLANALKIYL